MIVRGKVESPAKNVEIDIVGLTKALILALEFQSDVVRASLQMSTRNRCCRKDKQADSDKVYKSSVAGLRKYGLS